MKRIIYICLLLAVPFISLAQESLGSTKEQGDAAYAEKRYADAIAIYETLLEEQGSTLPLHYNLGNAYFKTNQFGKAILNYERALRIDANDEDTNANLEIAQGAIKDKIPQDEVPFYKRWWQGFTGIFSKDLWGVIGVITFIGVLVALFFYFFRKEMRHTSLVIAIVCVVFTILANVPAGSLASVNDSPEAVIMDEMVFIRNAPDDSGTELTKIHEGLKVKVIDEVKDWVKIEADNGNRIIGWVKSKSLERI